MIRVVDFKDKLLSNSSSNNVNTVAIYDTIDSSFVCLNGNYIWSSYCEFLKDELLSDRKINIRNSAFSSYCCDGNIQYTSEQKILDVSIDIFALPQSVCKEEELSAFVCFVPETKSFLDDDYFESKKEILCS